MKRLWGIKLKKLKRLNQLKNDNIMNVSYAVVDLLEYNNMLYKNIKSARIYNEMYEVIYDSTLSKQKKYDKLKDIIDGK